MIFIFIGFIVGVAVVQGPLIWLKPVFESICISLVEYGNSATAWALQEISTVDGTSKLISLLGPALGVMIPGIVALLLMTMINLADTARKAASGISILGAFVGFFFLDPTTALVILVAAIVLSIFATLTTGLAFKAPLAVLVMVLAITYTSQMISGHDPVLGNAVTEFTLAAGTGDPDIWRISLTALGIFPFLVAIWSTLKD